MAENIFICKHQMGAGWCEIHDDYCVEGPCPDSSQIEYAPVVHGCWSLRQGEDGYYLECSECHRQVPVTGDVTDWAKMIEPYPYCHCGAKMSRG